MDFRSSRKVLGLAFLAMLICVPARAQQDNSQQSNTGDPVADAARKAKAQKKDAPKPKKVITDDDLVTKKSDISVVGTAPAQTDQTATQPNPDAAKPGDAKPADKDKDKEKEDPNSETAWRRRFSELRTKIATAEQELDILQREENKADVQYYT